MGHLSTFSANMWQYPTAPLSLSQRDLEDPDAPEAGEMPDLPVSEAEQDAFAAQGLTVCKRTERYVLTRLVQAILKPFKPTLVRPKKGSFPYSTRLNAPKKVLQRCDVEERQVEGLWIYDLTRDQTKQDKRVKKDYHRRRILYIAGGGWQMPPSKHHWAFCAELVCQLSNTKVTIISCPLAPQNPVSVAFPQIERAYKNLLKESARAGEVVVLAGDSSGANIALCLVTWTLMTQRPDAVKPPAAVVAICPATDLRHQLPEIKQVDKFDPVLSLPFINATASTWAPGPVRPPAGDRSGSRLSGQTFRLDWSLEDPRVSPIQADLSPLARHEVRVHGMTASYDVLEPEGVVFREKCKQEGVSGEWLSWSGQMHCFPLAFRYGLRESKEAVDWIINVLDKC